MSRLKPAVMCTALLMSACKVERTPVEYIDHRASVAAVRDAAAEELHARLLAMGQALNRGDASEALQALSPASDAYVIIPDQEAILTGEEQIATALDGFANLEGSVRMSEVQVNVGPRATVAWFRAQLERSGGMSDAPLRISGVYVRGDEGGWRLAQAHLSMITVAPDPIPSDSLAPSPASGGDPPAGE